MWIPTIWLAYTIQQLSNDDVRTVTIPKWHKHQDVLCGRYYCHHLTKITVVTPKHRTMRLRVRQPTKHDGRSVTRKSSHSFFFLLSSTAVESWGGEGRRNLRAHSTDVIPYLWKLFNVIPTSEVSTTFHAEHSPLASSEWMGFLSVY